MNTVFLLMAEFQRADVPLETVAERYLGMDKKRAYMQAARAALPFPAYRAGGQKSPWMVRVTDLAAWLDSARDKAAQDWRNVNAA